MNKTTLYAIGRWSAVIVAIVFLICHFSTGGISDTPIEKVDAAVTAGLDMSKLEKSDENILHRDYGLIASDYDGFALYSPVSFMDPEEILIVKLADPSQAAVVQAAMEKRLEERTSVFDSGYGPEQYALLTQHAEISVEGNYVLFVVSKNADAALQAFLDTL